MKKIVYKQLFIFIFMLGFIILSTHEVQAKITIKSITYDTKTVCSHSWVKTRVTKNPTCTSTGTALYTCSRCRKTKTQSLPSLGHNYQTKSSTASTCTTYGYRLLRCSRCGSQKTESLSLKNHNYTAQKAESKYLKSIATCNSPAVYYKSCTMCGKKGSSTFTYGQKLSHVYKISQSQIIAQATCHSKGCRLNTCILCGKKVSEEIAMLSHKYTRTAKNEYLKSIATCSSPAIYYTSCSLCGKKGTSTFTYGDALGHNYQTKSSRNSTCTQNGYKIIVCSNCGLIKSEALPLSEHAYSQKVDPIYLVSEASCTSPAIYYESCTMCGEIGDSTFTYGDTIEHNYIDETKISATLTKDGRVIRTCLNCGDTIVETLNSFANYLKSKNIPINISGGYSTSSAFNSYSNGFYIAFSNGGASLKDAGSLTSRRGNLILVDAIPYVGNLSASETSKYYSDVPPNQTAENNGKVRTASQAASSTQYLLTEVGSKKDYIMVATTDTSQSTISITGQFFQQSIEYFASGEGSIQDVGSNLVSIEVTGSSIIPGNANATSTFYTVTYDNGHQLLLEIVSLDGVRHDQMRGSLGVNGENNYSGFIEDRIESFGDFNNSNEPS